MRNPEALGASTLPNRKSSYQTLEEEKQARQDAVEAQLNAWRALLPGLLEKLARIKDPRRPKSTKHRLTTLMFFGLLLFVFQCASRREANRELSRPGVLESLRSVFPEIDSTPHMDTLERLLEEIPAEKIEDVLGQTVAKLLRSKKLQALLVDKRYVVVVDGTQKFTRTIPFAKEALHRQRGDATTYIVYVLEAVLVGPQGIVIPLLAEFCENKAEDKNPETKQDCELKAFYRLAARLKKLLSRQRLLIVADGLYPCGPVMSLCRKNRWDFMIILPASCLVAVWEDALGIRRLEPEQSRANRWGDHDQAFWWANDIQYDWRDADGHHHCTPVHVAVCHETWEKNGEACQATWAWVSGSPITKKNVLARCNRAGRRRWGIEENFLTEKQQGYSYEHTFSEDWNAMKGWHALMRLAHLLNTLTLHTVALWDTVQVLGLRGALRFLRETLSGNWLDASRLRALLSKPAQLRLVI
ncbi:MAG: hypothetical protein DDT29_01889 [Dehalococcoidia bacterium]|nr:hypothetical protein [Bacillota bacterium]